MLRQVSPDLPDVVEGESTRPGDCSNVGREGKLVIHGRVSRSTLQHTLAALTTLKKYIYIFFFNERYLPCYSIQFSPFHSNGSLSSLQNFSPTPLVRQQTSPYYLN